MTCPYCKRNEGHYLGCQEMEKPGMYQSWGELAKVVAMGIGVMVLVILVVRLIGGGN